MITDQVLIENGYKRHKPDIFHEGASDLYQKRIDDSNGKKYFINIYKYNFKDIPNHPFPNKIYWQSEVQLFLVNDKVCNIEYFGNLEDINDIENFFNDIWYRMGIFKYYEIFE